MVESLQGTITAKMLDRGRLLRIADGLAVALVVSLPWSTSATGILAVLWLVALVPTLDAAGLRREVLTPAGGLPVLLWGLGVLGMLWADVPLADRLQGLGSFHKLLFIPLLLFHFRRSEFGAWIVMGFLASCAALLAASTASLVFPSDLWPVRNVPGVPVKDYLSQSAMFIVAIAIAIDLAREAWQKNRLAVAFGWVAASLGFAANILFVATSRTALIFLPVLILLFGLKRLDWKRTLAMLAALVVLTAAAWPFSAYLRERVTNLLGEFHDYRTMNVRTSVGERLEFWKKSLTFVAAAPLIGHGTGTISEQFRRVATGDSGASAAVSANPHNQTLAVAIQLGLMGIAALFALWLAHLLLFRGEGFAAWLGLVIVVQNIVGSLFNSHLFDFTHGWGYVIGVGIAGGIVLRDASQRAHAPEPQAGEKPS